jgi:hypothetical protein
VAEEAERGEKKILYRLKENKAYLKNCISG